MDANFSTYKRRILRHNNIRTQERSHGALMKNKDQSEKYRF
jgi:hypothetical protein